MNLGTFELLSGTAKISDPCYDLGTWCAGDVKNVKSGTWNASIVEIDGCPAYLVCSHEEHECAHDDSRLRDTGIDVGVDSGQCGVFDEQCYKDQSSERGVLFTRYDRMIDPDDMWYSLCCDRTLGDNRAGVITYGAVSRSGHGDGSYKCMVARDGDTVVGIVLDFGIEELEEEEVW